MNSADQFAVTVSSVTGLKCEVAAIPTESVSDLKQRVCEKLGVANEAIRLLANER